MNVAETVLDIVRARASRTLAADDVSGDVALGSGGLGLDSIAIAEVLLDCQERFGVNVTRLLEGEPLTMRLLVEHLQQETPA
jgi:acyl carrier protein